MEWAKYQELVEQCQMQGWKAHCEPIKIGRRHFAGWSLYRTYTLLGISKTGKRKVT